MMIVNISVGNGLVLDRQWLYFWTNHDESRLTRLFLEKKAAISQMIYSDAFCEFKVLYFD